MSNKNQHTPKDDKQTDRQAKMLKKHDTILRETPYISTNIQQIIPTPKLPQKTLNQTSSLEICDTGKNSSDEETPLIFLGIDLDTNRLLIQL